MAAGEYRIYDLNSMRALRDYAPEKMEYLTDHYTAAAEKDIALQVLSAADGGALTVRKCTEDALVYLTFTAEEGTIVTLDDGTSSSEHTVGESGELLLTLHSDCTVTASAARRSHTSKSCATMRPSSPRPTKALPKSSTSTFWLTQSFTL